MRAHILKSLMPRGFYGRAALIMLVPIITVMIVLSVVFIQRHFDRVTDQMTSAIVSELRFLIDQLDAAPGSDDALERLAPMARALQLDLSRGRPADVPARDLRRVPDLAGVTVIRALRDGTPGYRAVDLHSDSRVAVLWTDSAHGLLEVTINRNRLSPSNPHQLLVIVLLAAVVMSFISVLFLRNQVRPIRKLATAAEAFGKGQVVPYRPAGAAEIRAAGHAFVDMRDRIERQIEQRTLMLSGVSHDMRTPLTRMRLTLSMMEPGDDRAALEEDVAEMEALIDSFLDFARGQRPEDPDATDPDVLIREVLARRAAPERLSYSGGAVAPVVLRARLVERALDNLLGNALRYARRAEITLQRSDKALEITVEDDGPGIPPARRDEAKRPFVRLDAARNQDRGGGVGLGLAIAEDAMRSHGGRLELSQSPRLGGLCARLVIPL